MAKITLLHWNIQSLSQRKSSEDRNGGALINYIAWVVGQTQPNIISILELKNNAVDTVAPQLIAAIDLVNGEADPDNTKWSYVNIDSGENGEAYVIFYQAGHKFKPLEEKKARIFNLTTQAKVTEKEGSLEFNSKRSIKGGREPFYMAFQTDEEKKFTVIAVHLMFSEVIPYREAGLENVGKVAQNKNVLYKGKATPLEASLTAGDFNVYYSDGLPGSYRTLLDLPSDPATTERTTLISYIGLVPPETSMDYRVSAYDNIFLFKRTSPPPKIDGAVLDLIDDSATEPKGSGLLSDPAEAFDREFIRDGEEIQNIPPEDYEDSFRIVKRGVSDHLPVVLTFEI